MPMNLNIPIPCIERRNMQICKEGWSANDRKDENGDDKRQIKHAIQDRNVRYNISRQKHLKHIFQINQNKP